MPTGVYKRKKVDITGQTFGKLTAIKERPELSYPNSITIYWDFKCDCGNTKTCRKYHVTGGKIKTCGCIWKEIIPHNKTHGLGDSRIMNTWLGMKGRCNRKSDVNYKNYGGSGIKIIWNSFQDFIDDMLESYNDHVEKFGEKQTQIDRINPYGNYSKENCRWVTLKEQANNKKRNYDKN